jgi:hypothetical protein
MPEARRPPARGAAQLQTAPHDTTIAFMLRCALPDSSYAQHMTSPFRSYLLLGPGRRNQGSNMYLVRQLFVKYIFKVIVACTFVQIKSIKIPI